jgi:hypothetical protein
MHKWLWYVGWLFAWFIALSFVFIPLSNVFKDGGAASGFLRGLILVSAAIVLVLGVGFIYRKFRDAEAGHAGSRDHSAHGAAMGMSDREALLVASARDEAFGRIGADPSAYSARTPSRTADPTPARTGTPTHAATFGGNQEPPAGVMKSAGNPAVRSAFAQAMKEVDTRTCEPGLWAMALVECNGDEKAARIAYMRQRATDIVWAEAITAASAPGGAPRTDAGTPPRR